jgi:hypothetical protein
MRLLLIPQTYQYETRRRQGRERSSPNDASTSACRLLCGKSLTKKHRDSVRQAATRSSPPPAARHYQYPDLPLRPPLIRPLVAGSGMSALKGSRSPHRKTPVVNGRRSLVQGLHPPCKVHPLSELSRTIAPRRGGRSKKEIQHEFFVLPRRERKMQPTTAGKDAVRIPDQERARLPQP